MPGIFRPLLGKIAVAGLCALLAACAPNTSQLAPGSADQPWNADAQNTASGETAAQTGSAQANGVSSYALTPNPALSELARQDPPIDTSRAYDLAELIDIAQRSSPATRLAWERARQAALGVGMVESTYLPVITASVLAGGINTALPNPVPIGQRNVQISATGVSPIVAFEWLVFDFGRREAASKVAQEGSFAANVLFNAAHQELILNVATSYYRYGAAQTALKLARQSQSNANAVLAAVEARLANGRATTVELAQARQQVAQARLRVVTAEGQLRDSHQAVLTAMGVNPTLPLKIRETGQRALPARVDDTAEGMIRLALSRRPDVAASYSAVKASKAGVDMAEANYMPKVFVAGAAGTNSYNYKVGNLPGFSDTFSTTGVMLGASVPIYDGGLRKNQLRNAQSQVKTAEQAFRKTQNAAVSEIVIASNVLRTSLESYRAAGALAQAAATTYDAALEAYSNGLGTVTVANEANTALLDARLAQTEAHAASLISAVNLAFLTGALTSGEAIGLPGVKD